MRSDSIIHSPPPRALSVQSLYSQSSGGRCCVRMNHSAPRVPHFGGGLEGFFCVVWNRPPGFCRFTAGAWGAIFALYGFSRLPGSAGRSLPRPFLFRVASFYRRFGLYFSISIHAVRSTESTIAPAKGFPRVSIKRARIAGLRWDDEAGTRTPGAGRIVSGGERCKPCDTFGKVTLRLGGIAQQQLFLMACKRACASTSLETRPLLTSLAAARLA